MDNIEIDKFENLHNLVDLYAKSVFKEDCEIEIEKEIVKFQSDKDIYLELTDFFEDKSLYDFAENTLSRYLAHKCVGFRDAIKQLSQENILSKYTELIKLIDRSNVKDLFKHYINTYLLLNNINVENNGNFINLEKYLNPVSWEFKTYLYGALVEKIVKINMKKTKSSVIIISNGGVDYVYETIFEINKQNNKSLYKIIFVSNNHNNQTKKIINLVDTFIQMKSNNGAYLARNVGSIFSLSDVLIFLEDDGIPQENFVKEHEKIWDKDIVSVRGACLSKTNGVMPDHYWMGCEIKSEPVGLEGNCSFMADDFFRVGGWGDYILFGHGGLEICHRMLKRFSFKKQHIYSPSPVIYHDAVHPLKDLIKKKRRHYASWQLLKYSYKDFHETAKWK